MKLTGAETLERLDELLQLYVSNERLLRLMDRIVQAKARARAAPSPSPTRLVDLRHRQRVVLRRMEANWLEVRRLASDDDSSM